MAHVCNYCAKVFASAASLDNHSRRFNGACGRVMTDEEYSSLKPCAGTPRKVFCTGCSKEFTKRYIVTHIEKEHPEYAEVVKQWHIFTDFKMAK